MGDTLLPPGGSVVFTLTEDFLAGEMFNVNASDVPDELRLNAELSTYPFIWIANSSEGTLSKFDTRTGRELGRYRTGAESDVLWLYPSRIAVTSEGDAWVANRGMYYPSQDTVVKVLRESFVDRNGNGIADTSQDFNGDGRISGSEMLPWDANGDGQPDDERIALSVPVGRVQDYPEVLRIDGLARAVAIDANDDVWVGLNAHRQYEVYDGQTGEFKAIVPTPGNPYGAVIDGEGQLWGSSIAQGVIDHIDTATYTYVEGIPGFAGGPYGVTLDEDGVVWTPSHLGKKLFRYDPTTGTLDSYPVPFRELRGVAVDHDRNVWVASTIDDCIIKLVFADDHLTLLGQIVVPLDYDVSGSPSPTGLTAAVIDADGFVWTTGRSNNTAWKIDPSTNTVVDGWPIPTGSYPYNYSDMTGHVRLTVTDPTGTWTETIDGQRDAMRWGAVLVEQETPGGTSVRVRVRSSDTRTALGSVPWAEVPSGQPLHNVLGRYLQVQVVLRSDSRNVTPSVQAVTVAAAPPPPIVSIQYPADGTAIPVGSHVVIDGHAEVFPLQLGPQTTIPNAITLMTMDDVPVEALDAAGNFFDGTDIAVGQNEFTASATDMFGQMGFASVTLEGVHRDEGEINFDQLSDVSASFRVEYARTSFDEESELLFAGMAVVNAAPYTVDVPLLVGVANISDPAVRVHDPDGVTPEGIPYFDYTPLVTDRTLQSGQMTDSQILAFHNPGRSPFTYRLVFMGKLNEPPTITTVPTISTEANRPYRYAVAANDPDNDPVMFSLVVAPDGMSVDSTTGEIVWNPSVGDVGTACVGVRAKTVGADRPSSTTSCPFPKLLPTGHRTSRRCLSSMQSLINPTSTRSRLMTPSDDPLAFSFPLAYTEAVLGDEPIAYWRLGESSGDKAVNSGTIGSADRWHLHRAGDPRRQRVGRGRSGYCRGLSRL